MIKIDNFRKSLDILENADFKIARENDIYRTGIIGQFNITFELAWKALQSVLRLHGINEAETGSPREILKLGYKFGFLADSDNWLEMLRRRNISIHVYDKNEAIKTVDLIKNKFIRTFSDLLKALEERYNEANKEW